MFNYFFNQKQPRDVWTEMNHYHQSMKPEAIRNGWFSITFALCFKTSVTSVFLQIDESNLFLSLSVDLSVSDYLSDYIRLY